jgi:Iron/manganese superoxide dismutases, C-terminal domain
MKIKRSLCQRTSKITGKRPASGSATKTLPRRHPRFTRHRPPQHSGWAWLCADKKGHLVVENTGNQDSPLMAGLMSGIQPILGLDAWEHAHYLKYENRGPEYIAAFYNVINWPEVARRYAAARA